MRKLFCASILFLVMMLLMSCATTEKASVIIPDVPYPEFPIDVTDPAIAVTFNDGYVSIKSESGGKNADIPLWLWLELTEYSIDVDSAIAQYKAIIRALER